GSALLAVRGYNPACFPEPGNCTPPDGNDPLLYSAAPGEPVRGKGGGWISLQPWFWFPVEEVLSVLSGFRVAQEDRPRRETPFALKDLRSDLRSAVRDEALKVWTSHLPL
ncbi:hypothetical protein NFI96_014337, partial [Prochilodus magdalenae]